MSYIPTDTIRRTARTYVSPFFNRVPLLWSRCTGNQGAVAHKGGTTRLGFVTTETCADFQFVYENYALGSGGETPVGNPITIIPVFEPTANVFLDIAIDITPTFVNAAGQAAYTIPQNGRLKSDVVAITAGTAGTQLNTRTHVMVSLPPTLSGTTSTTGGTLPASTAYSYTVTQVAGPQGESGPGTAVALTTGTGGTNSNTLTWAFDPLSVPNTAVCIYRGALLLATLPANTTTWTDTGALSVGTQAPPPAQKIPQGPSQGQTAYLTGQGNNLASWGGTGANTTRTIGTAWETATAYGYGPSCILATPDSGGNKAVCLIVGDSLAAGQGSVMDLGYIGQALLAAGIPWYLIARPGEYSSGFLGNTARMRLGYAGGASDAIEEYGINDTFNGVALATLQANCISTWRELRRRGVLRIHRPTLSPRVLTTDTMQTLAGQSPGSLTVTAATNASPVVVTSSLAHGFADASPVTIIAAAGNTAANGSYYAKVTGYSATTFGLYSDAGLTTPVAGNGAWTSGGYITPNPAELARQAFDAWVIDGCPLNPATFAPQPLGTANGATCVRAPFYAAGGTVLVTPGYGGHPVASCFNPWAAIEVNAAGTPTVNGGRWPVNGTAGYATPDGTHPTTAMTAVAAQQVPTALMVAPL